MDLTERISKLSPEQGKLLAMKLQQRNINIDMLKLPITRENQAKNRQRFPLSLQQERLWFIHQLSPDTTAYNIVNPTKLKGSLDKHALEQSINEMIKRHDILRTIFISDKQAPAQVILNQLSVPLEIIDLTGSSKEKQECEVRQIIRDESLYVFDLAAGPLLKTKLVVLSENEHIFLLVIHHMICDGTSIRIFIRELVQLYEFISEGKPSHLPELSIGYVDYACWQRQWLGLLKHQEKFWLEQFKGEIPVLDLPLDYPRPGTQDFQGSTSLFHLSANESKALKEMALKENTTLYVVLLTLYNIFLSKVSGMEDIVVGTPAAGRRHPDLQKLIGMFVNTLALRNYPHHNKTYKDLLAEVKNRTLKALENQEYQYEDLLGQVRVARDNSRNPLFDVMFLLGNVDVEHGEIKTRGLTLDIYDYENKTSKFDLTLRAWEQGDILYFSFEYRTKLFKEATIQRMIDYFKRIATSTIENPARKIKEIEIISPQKKREILSQFNRDLKDTFDVDTIQHKLSRNFQEYPDHAAIEYGAVQVSYSQLDKKSTGISRRLRHHEIEKGSFIGIYQDDQIEIISLIIGILKAGCVFVPLDTALPVKRVQQMAQLVCPRLIFTTAAHQEQLINDWQDRAENIEFIDVDASFHKQCRLLPPREQEVEYKGDDHIYIYFTSGTTGAPRAILGKNTSLLQFINWEIDTFAITSAIRVSQLAAVGFDAFLRNVFTPLCAGGVVCIPGNRDVVMDSESFIHWIHQRRIHLIHCVPAVFRLFNWETVTPGHFKNLKYVLMAGDIVYPHELERWYRKFDNRVELVNCYGTTETTMFKTYYRIQKTDSRKERIPVGRCISGASIIILDGNMNVCDQGIVGEIYIRTPYRTGGYYNAPQLNKETFIPNPFNHDPCDLVARTGDLGRWLEDGNIEFLGRKDARVKIRGVRIELEEIENQLLNHKEIKECVVAARSEPGAAATGNYEENDLYLCAYIVSARKPPIPRLREYLLQYLPGYMIPAYFVFLDRLPLTANLKIDRTALPEPEPETADNDTAPRTAAEKKLAEIWSDVLKTGKRIIGINSNFFQLGGHSLKAANMAAQVHKQFQVKLPLAEIFRSPTIKGLSRYIRRAVQNKYTPIKAIEKKEYYSLSSAQKRLYILHQMDVNSTAYNMPQVIPLAESPAVEKLEKAFLKLIHRHESLRTSFAMIHDQPVQKTHQPDEIQFAVQYYDMREVEVEEECSSVLEGTRGLAPLTRESHLSSEFIRPFDLSRAPLIRVGLIKIKPLKHILMIDMHHIISDAISLRLMKEDFTAIYENRKLDKLRIGYKDYAEWQNSSQQKKAIKKQEEYWLKEFNDGPSMLNLPFDYPRPVLQSFAGDRVYFEIGKEQQEALEKTAKLQDATLFMVLLAAYNVFLAKLTGQEDIIIGTPTAGRQHPDLEHIIGMFVNTLVLRNYPAVHQPFRCFLEETKQRTLQAFDQQDYQFEDLVEKISLERDIGRNPLFDVMFSLHNLEDYPGDTAGIETETHFDAYRKKSEISKFDMTFIGVHSSDKLTFIVEYCTKLFKKETIDRFIGYFNRILSHISRGPGILLSRIDIISEEEKHRLLYDFNDTAGWFPGNKTLHQLFQEQVEQSPDKITIVGPMQLKNRTYMTYMTHISYRELNEKSDQLARLLIGKGVQPDTIAGIIAEPSVETIVGIIGILKAGGAYLPIDPEYPRDRIDFMLKDSGAKILVTSPGLTEKFEKLLIVNETPPNHRRLNTPPKEANSINNYQLTINNLQLKRANLAYVIYTSGSTGIPKGVIVSHGNIINQIVGLQKLYPFDDTLHHILMAPFTFDPSVQQIFLPLTTGGRLLLVTNPVKNDAVKLLDLIVSHRLNIFNTVPSFMNVLLDHIDGDSSRRFYFKYIILAGEVFSKELYIKLTGKFFIEKLINIYGPTEATINTTWYECLPGEKNDVIPIGKPLMNYKVLILDDRQELVPTGVPGEICISGQGLAPGYLNQPGLTAEKFVPVYRSYRSYRSYISNKLYKTGDLARWTAGGIIEFLGRIDEQVKIRGIRVELGEIESQLLKHHKIKEAVVLAKEDGTGDKYLAAYIVSDKPGIDVELKNYLSHFIPDYMIPSYFVELEKIPLTPNGKINRKALPEPQITQTGENYTAPRDEIERKLVEIWAGVLARDAAHASQLRESISIDDNFFELGGHSLKAIILTAKIHKNMNVKISLAEFFNAPFIRKLSARVSSTPENRCKAITPVEKKDFYALSSAQMRLYILQQMDLNSTAYNIPQVVVLEGSIDKMRLYDTLNRLIHRHESLRTSFPIVEEEPVQKIHEEVEFEMENDQVEVEVKVKENEGTRGKRQRTEDRGQKTENRPGTYLSSVFRHLSSEFIRPFDLSCAPLLRAGLIQGNPGDKYILMVDMHHIISDEVSHDIFIKDLLALYGGNELPGLRLQYKDFSQWQNNRIKSGTIKEQQEYWLKTFAGDIPLLNMPTDYKRPEVLHFEGHTIAFEISSTLYTGIKTLVSESKTTLNILLLAAYNVLLSKYTGLETILVGNVIAGRRHADLQNIIGFFVNMLAMKNHLEGEQTFEAFLDEVKENSVKAYENQDYQFEELVGQLKIEREAGRHPLIDTVFVLQDPEDNRENIQAMKESGLKANPGKIEHNVSHFDLMLHVTAMSHSLSIVIEYSTALFKQATIEELAKCYKEVLEQLVKNKKIKLKEINIHHDIMKECSNKLQDQELAFEF